MNWQGGDFATGKAYSAGALYYAVKIINSIESGQYGEAKSLSEISGACKQCNQKTLDIIRKQAASLSKGLNVALSKALNNKKIALKFRHGKA